MTVASQSPPLTATLPDGQPAEAGDAPLASDAEELDLTEPPKPLNLSQKAIEQRLRRVCKADKTGNFKVPEQVVKEFEDVSGGGRTNLLKKFEQCGFDRAGTHMALEHAHVMPPCGRSASWPRSSASISASRNLVPLPCTSS